MSAEQEQVEALATSISGCLSNVSHLPGWMQTPALGRDTRPLLLLAARAVLASDWLAEHDAQVRAEATAAVAALHVERVQPIFDEAECADRDCGHPEGTCVIVATSVCAHCADQTAPDEPWEHMVREAAYWPCATIRALTPDAGAALRAREAKALRDAADAALEHFGTWGGAGWADWLRTRADALEARTEA